MTVRFGGIHALTDVSLRVGRNEVVGLIGPNGAGKTTLFNVVTGYVRPQSGRVLWRGEAQSRLRPHHLKGLKAARTFQGLNLFGSLTVLENVMLAAEARHRFRTLQALLGTRGMLRTEHAIRSEAIETLDFFGIADVSQRLPSELPYGIQKRVALARAMVQQPDMVLLDEPASGLTSGDIETLASELKAFRGQRSVLLVEHNVGLVMAVSDRIVVLEFGRVIAEGRPDDIRKSEDVIRAYLGTVEE